MLCLNLRLLRRSICLLSLLLLTLQLCLYLQRGHYYHLEMASSAAASAAAGVAAGAAGAAGAAASAAAAAAASMPTSLSIYARVGQALVDLTDTTVESTPTSAKQSKSASTGSAPTVVTNATQPAAAVLEVLQSRTAELAAAANASVAPAREGGSVGKGCYPASGTPPPRNRILIIHEQHLQSMGCDVRLLRFIKDLLYLNQEVSMFFRGSTPSKMRQPKSKQLASILQIADFEEDELRKGLREPPGLYEWTTAERFGQLMGKGYFNMIIIFLWFWYDPQPSVTELVLPLIRAYSPPDKQPFVALLSDDAHAIRSSRLGEVEIHPATRDGYNERARNYWIRQRNMYRLVDMVMYISAMDQVAEKESYPFIPYYRLLRMPIRAFRILSKSTPAPMQDRSFLTTSNIGFIGNGLTPTNHLGIQWFLEHCWEDVRRQLPGVRMRLIGRPPGERMRDGVQVPCVKTEDPHCGWAWGTVYSGVEEQHGIDEMGYLSAEGLLEEVLSWRLMIVPVLRTTGVNTKILVALELGIPLVITPVAASPFDFDESETIVAFASQAADFVQQTVSVYTISWLWTTLSRESRRHWEDLATHDPARGDVKNVLSTVCVATGPTGYRKWVHQPISGEPATPALRLPPRNCDPTSLAPSGSKAAAAAAAGCANAPKRSKQICFAPSNLSAVDGSPPLMLAAAHSPQLVFPLFEHYVQTIWDGICAHCNLRCAMRKAGAAYSFSDVDLLIDLHWSLPLEKLDGLRHRLVFYSWDPGKLGRYYHYTGNLLEMVGVMERFVAQVLERPETSVRMKINQEMRSPGGFVFSWRRTLGLFGMTKPAINKVVDLHIQKISTNWSKDLAAHMNAFKSG